MSHSPVSPGDVLLGKYRVDRLLGVGGMGVVVAATHLLLGERVAIKFMLPGKGPQDEQWQRFVNEGRACARLKTAHVARVLDVGAMETGAPYIIMEHLEGRDLAAELRERGRLPVEEAAHYVLQICEALAETHRIGIVHRDVKPANLFLTRDSAGHPVMKLLDYGMSKHATSDVALTGPAEMLGSPLYMAPEQMRSSVTVDGRADLWALCVTLYELVTGLTPFHEVRMERLLARVLFEEPVPLADRGIEAPPGFQAVLFHGLEKDRDHLYKNAAELAAALAPYAPARAAVYAERAAAMLGVEVAPERPTAELPPAPAPGSGLGGSGTVKLGALAVDAGKARARKRTGVVLAMVALAAAVAVAGVARWRTKSGPEPAVLSAVSTTPPPVALPVASTAQVADAPDGATTAAPVPEPTATADARAPDHRPPRTMTKAPAPKAAPDAEPKPPPPTKPSATLYDTP